jgi:cobaltochelatase CobN
MKVCIVAVGASSIIETRNVLRSWEGGPWAGKCDICTHYVGSDFISESQWPRIFKDIYESRFLLLDTMGVPNAFGDALAEGLAGYKGHIAVVNATTVALRALTRLGGFSLGMIRRMESGSGKETGPPDAARMMKMTGWMEKLGRTLPVGPLRDMRNFLWIGKYWLSGTRQNIESMLHLIGREYFDCKDFPKPVPPAVIEDCTVMDPASGRMFSTLQDYHGAFPPDKVKPSLALLFRARAYPLDTHPVVCRVRERLSGDFNVIPIALDSTVGRDFRKLYDLLMPNGTPLIDVLVNPESFRLAQGPMGGDAAIGERFLRDLNVPVLHPFFLTKRTRGQWLCDLKGADVGEFLISIFLPELDGDIEMYPVAAVGTPQDRTPELSPIEDRIDHLALRALNWSALRRMPNCDKRLALILYNYPAGEATVGSASFLDTFASVAALLEKLAAQGYAVTPMTPDELKSAFVESGVNNAGGWKAHGLGTGIAVDEKTYRLLTDSLPGIERIDQAWGPFPGPVMSRGRSVMLPGIINGNVFIGLQPPRAVPESCGGSYHDKTVPPHHQYAAFYRWITGAFRANAVVHVGTHGTLEFLPGKEKAASSDCFPDALTGEVPHLYIYYTGNPSEAMIARRRSHAVLIGHLPPPFVKGGLYGELQDLRQLLDEHAEAQSLNPARCPLILEDIRKAAATLGWEGTGLEDVHRRLHEMKDSLIPSRLHTLGQPFGDAEIASYLAELFRTKTRDGCSFYGLLARQLGLDWQRISSEPHQQSAQREQLETRALQWISDHILQGLPLQKGKGADCDAFLDYLRRGEAVAKALSHNSEIDAVLSALSGGYIPAGLSGDMFRSPEVLPPGRNLVQFDPRLVPSPSALLSGAAIAENTIDRYKKQHGRYPRSTAVILWGLETSQTQGETIGQILAYLGARTATVADQWDPKVELMSLAELGRPRIDVTIQICGFFRDMFPTALAVIQKALELAGFADEPDDMNFVRANARLLFSALSGRGMQEAEAREFALARVFGPAGSEYGTGLERLVKNRSWQEESALVGAYIESLKYAYTPGHYGVEMGGLLTENLSLVEVVSQVRGSRDYEITDLDHYYEFFGGLARSVEQASGRKAMMLVSDTHEGSVCTEDVKESICRGVHTRLINPAWLDAMLGHSHHGGQEIAKRMENMIGLAATTGAVDQATFDQVNRRLVFDDAMRERIRQNNPYAMLEIVKRLWEANTRGYWQPDEETLGRLKEIYLGLETHLEGMHQ